MNVIHLSKLDGTEVTPGVFIIGEPTPIPGTNTMVALANVYGCLCKVELSITFAKQT